MMFLYLVATCGMHALLGIYVAFLIYKNGKHFFMYFWSYFDLAILFLFLILASVNLTIWAKAAGEPNLQPEIVADPEMFYPLGRLVPDLELATSMLSLLGLFAWLKILKYFSLIGTFQALV